VVLHHIRGRSGKLRRVAAPQSARIKDLAAASDAVAEIHAGYVVAGTAFKVALLAIAPGLDEIVPGVAEQRVAARSAGQPLGAALPYVLRTFNLEFALISHYGECKCVASKYGVRASLASLGRRRHCTETRLSLKW
jgi:hypothetical protein